MTQSFRFNAEEPLWAVPSGVAERLRSRQLHTEFNAFVFCGVYSVVAVLFLLIFGVAALERQEPAFAAVIFGFAGMTVLSYGLIWLSKQYYLAKHLIAVLMASLCLYLFHTGGTQGTDPVFYMAFPMVAVFLQGFIMGSVYIAGLLVLTLLVYLTGFLDFDTTQYDFVFISRIATVFAITSFLAIFYSYFKYLSERELLLIYEDLEQVTFADRKTGIANRQLMEKLLVTEYKRYQRYGLKFSILLVTIDAFDKIRRQHGQDSGDIIFRSIAEVFQKSLRQPDIPGLWDREEFLILLPHTGMESARLVAQRLARQISEHQFYLDGVPEKATATIAIREASEEDLSTSLQKLEMLLYKASRQQGNQVISE